MAFQCIKLLRNLRSTTLFRHSLIATTVALPKVKFVKPKQFKTEDSLVYSEDPDNFGTLSKIRRTVSEELKDEDDIKEEKFIQNLPLRSQKLTIKQYADLIKQYLQHKRLKQAIDVLEVKMLKEDRVKPANYIYNILIGACADVGYTKKAFKLYNEMKRRALKPTGDTYTCLFNACANSPWHQDGLKNAHHLKQVMIEKGFEPNLTNYNAMIKAFGRCGDLPTAFKIVDEMKQKKIKIRVHTLNHLLHACISDKNNGLHHALIVWRKILKLREKPNTYTFNLMLKCVKECNLGTTEDIIEVLNTIQSMTPQKCISNLREVSIESNDTLDKHRAKPILIQSANSVPPAVNDQNFNQGNQDADKTSHFLPTKNSKENITLQFVNKLDIVNKSDNRTVPNLLSKFLIMENVTALQAVHTVQDKFALIGGQDDFIKEMKEYSVKPNVKTFTLMLPLLDNSTEAENKLLETMKSLDIRADIDFYNMLIKKRCLRSDYESAVDVMAIIKKESEIRKKRFPHSKKLKLNVNIMTYGVLAMACKTKESAEKLLNEMNDKKLKVNIEILGTLLRQGTANNSIGYILYILNVVKKENIQVNDVFLKHLEAFNEKCSVIISKNHGSEKFIKSYEVFTKYYTNWLKDVNIEEVLKSEHPWQQFRDDRPGTVQRDGVLIKMPKKFYKPKRKYTPYVPSIK